MKVNRELIDSFDDLANKGITFKALPFFNTINFLCNPLIWRSFKSFSTTRTGIVVPDLMSFVQYTNMDTIEDKIEFKDAYLSVTKLYKHVLFGKLLYGDIVGIFKKYFKGMRVPPFVNIKGDGTGLFDTPEERDQVLAFLPKPSKINSGAVPGWMLRILLDIHFTKITPIIAEDTDNITRKAGFKEIVYRVGDGDKETSPSKYYIPDMYDLIVTGTKDPIIAATILNMLDILESPFIFLDQKQHITPKDFCLSATPPLVSGDRIYNYSMKSLFRTIMPCLIRLAKENGGNKLKTLLEFTRVCIRSSEFRENQNQNSTPTILYGDNGLAFLLLLTYRIYSETRRAYRNAVDYHGNKILNHILINDNNLLIVEGGAVRRTAPATISTVKLKKPLSYYNRRISVPLADDFKIPIADILFVEEAKR